jgi:hypothetical protein
MCRVARDNYRQGNECPVYFKVFVKPLNGRVLFVPFSFSQVVDICTVVSTQNDGGCRSNFFAGLWQ